MKLTVKGQDHDVEVKPEIGLLDLAGVHLCGAQAGAQQIHHRTEGSAAELSHARLLSA